MFALIRYGLPEIWVGPRPRLILLFHKHTQECYLCSPFPPIIFFTPPCVPSKLTFSPAVAWFHNVLTLFLRKCVSLFRWAKHCLWWIFSAFCWNGLHFLCHNWKMFLCNSFCVTLLCYHLFFLSDFKTDPVFPLLSLNTFDNYFFKIYFIQQFLNELLQHPKMCMGSWDFVSLSLSLCCLHSVWPRIPQKLRISGSLTVILVVFLLTAVFVKVDMAPLPFFTFTMIKIVCINCEFPNTWLTIVTWYSSIHCRESFSACS